MALDPDTISEDAARETLALLRDFRRQVIETLLATPSEFQRVHQERLREIDGMIQQFETGLRNVMRPRTEQAANAGDEAAVERLAASNIAVPPGFIGVSPTLVQTAAQYQADLITDLGNFARGRITTEVRRAALGNTPITELIQKIGANLDDRSIFKNIRDRAEAIARTEVSRVYSTAYNEQATEIHERYPQTEKTWIHAGGGLHSRPNHVALDGVTIPFDERFDLGNGITTPHPHWFGLPAGESVNCRCRLTISIPEAA